MLQSAASLAAYENPEIMQQKMADMLRGIQKYQNTKIPPISRPHTVIWQQGSVRLLRLSMIEAARDGAGPGRPLLLIPSLINGWEILDLLPDYSFARFLAQAGFDVYVCDWGDLRDDPEIKSIENLLRERLEPIVHLLSRLTSQPVMMAGYCMGGLLMAGVLPRVMDEVAGCAYLATPWDFHVHHPHLTKLVEKWAPQMAPFLMTSDFLPNMQIQSLFAMVDPEMAIRKFSNFCSLASGSPQEISFVATEDWLRSGRDLPRDMAVECIRDWYLSNLPGQGAWKVGEDAITPKILSGRKSIVVAPRRDKVVETASAAALYQKLGKNCSYLEPDIGHIGMMVSPRARAEVWEPLRDWLCNL